MKFEVKKTRTLGMTEEFDVRLADETKKKLRKIFNIGLYAGSAVYIFSMFRQNKETDTKNLNEVTTEES